MNYTAVNTKVLAKRSQMLNHQNYQALVCFTSIEALTAALTAIQGEWTSQSLFDEYKPIASFIHVKPVKDYIRTLAYGLAGAHASVSPGIAASGTEIKHWSYVSWRKLNMLDKPSREPLRRILGTEMDLRNIIWIYRLKQYHRIEGGATFGYLLPSGYRLPGEIVTGLVDCKDATAMIDILSQSPYCDTFKSIEDLRMGEQILTKIIRAKFRRENHSTNAACICGYLYEKHLEHKNIRAIKEGINLGFAPGDILKRLY